MDYIHSMLSLSEASKVCVLVKGHRLNRVRKDVIDCEIRLRLNPRRLLLKSFPPLIARLMHFNDGIFVVECLPYLADAYMVGGTKPLIRIKLGKRISYLNVSFNRIQTSSNDRAHFDCLRAHKPTIFPKPIIELFTHYNPIFRVVVGPCVRILGSGVCEYLMRTKYNEGIIFATRTLVYNYTPKSKVESMQLIVYTRDSVISHSISKTNEPSFFPNTRHGLLHGL